MGSIEVEEDEGGREGTEEVLAAFGAAGAADGGGMDGRCAAAIVGLRAGLELDAAAVTAGAGAAAATAGAGALCVLLLLLLLAFPLPPCLPMKQGSPKAIAAAWTSVAVAFAIPTGCNPASLNASTNSPNKPASRTSPPFPAASVRTPPRGKGWEVIHSPKSTTIGALLK